jgi:alpha-L-rhamnosidase
MASAAPTDCPWLRRSWELSEEDAQIVGMGLASVFAYVGSVGYHELYINGAPASDHVLSPDVTDLAKRVRFRTYNISAHVVAGPNAVGLWLGPGWSLFRGVNPVMDFNLTKQPLVIAQLHLVRANASTPDTILSTDSSWRAHTSTTSHLGKWTSGDFGGDLVDERLSIPDWAAATYDDHLWEQARVYALPAPRALTADTVEPTRRRSTVGAQSIKRAGPSAWLVTMEELFTGWLELNVSGRVGTSVDIEISTNAGTRVEYNMRDRIIIGPAGKGTFCNRFSYHEIHYVTISGLATAPSLNDIRGYRVGTDRKREGTFDCSVPLLKQIYDTTANNYEGLTTGGMTVDCPHRERLGYGGDGHTSMEFALTNYPSNAFFSKWAQDWGDIQEPNGYIAHTAPTIDGGGGPAWSGYVIAMPWQVYQTYNDTDILAAAYPHMLRLLDFFESKRTASGLVENWGGDWTFLGDWLTPHGSEESSSIEAVLFNNCYITYCTRIASQVARVLGDAATATTLAARLPAQAAAVTAKFFNTSTGVFLDSLQTHLVLPLISGIVDGEHLELVESALRAEIVHTKDCHLDTGLHGTYFMTKYLLENAQNDLVLAYARQTTFPSYGHFLATGYTTWPEQWDGAPSRMHGCFNGIGAWFQKGLLGVRPDPAFPGMQLLIVRPAAEAIANGVAWANGSVTAGLGTFIISWAASTTMPAAHAFFQLNLTLPSNTVATLYLPTADWSAVKEGGRPASIVPGVKLLRLEPWAAPGRQAVGPLAAVLQVGSGTFTFTSPLILPSAL